MNATVEISDRDCVVIEEAYRQTLDNIYHWGGDGFTTSDEEIILRKTAVAGKVELSLRQVLSILAWIKPAESVNMEQSRLAIKLLESLYEMSAKEAEAIADSIDGFQTDYAILLSEGLPCPKNLEEKREALNDIMSLIKKLRYKSLFFAEGLKKDYS